MLRSSSDNDRKSLPRIDSLHKAESRCIRLVSNRIMEYLFQVYCKRENVWTWYVLILDHDKKEPFLEICNSARYALILDYDKKEPFLKICNSGCYDVSDYGNVLLSGAGDAVPEEVFNKIVELVERFDEDFLLVQLQNEILYVLSNPGKKQEIMKATSCQEIKQYGRILFYNTEFTNDPPEALSIEILKGQFVDNKISDREYTHISRGYHTNGWISLHYQAYHGKLPSSGNTSGIHARDKICGRKPVHIAVREGHVDVVKFFLDNGAGVNESDNSGWTLLHYAAWKGNVALVKFLIQNKAEIKARDKCMGKEPIHVASEGGHVEVIQILLENGAGVNDSDAYGRTPLYYSAWEGCLETAKYLVARGANVNKANRYSNNPINVSAFVDNNKEMIGFLLSKGAAIDNKNEAGRTPLHQCACLGILDNVQYLIENGANINSVDNDNKTPLALSIKDSEVAIYLADKMQNMCFALYNQHQYSKALGILKDIYDNSGSNCEHLHSLRTKCLLGLSISYAGASYDEAVEVVRHVFQK